MRTATILLILLAGCTAPEPALRTPPLPPKPRPAHALFSRLDLTNAPPARYYLRWDDTNNPPATTTYELWDSTNLVNWKLFAVTNTHTYPLRIELPADFFKLRAVDINTGLTSDWAK